jgi:hypothetical protein
LRYRSKDPYINDTSARFGFPMIINISIAFDLFFIDILIKIEGGMSTSSPKIIHNRTTDRPISFFYRFLKETIFIRNGFLNVA